ncbi:MAG: PaaI family thioesterase [SAR324 cluster bacterium]|nr:PaaI family thioesterase [SAR324 cluster bacterium]
MDAVTLQNRIKGTFPDFLGIKFLEVSTRTIVAEMVVQKEFCNFSGYMHGGAVMTFADTLGALGTIVNMQENFRTTTLESKTNFLRSVNEGETITAESRRLHLGRSTMVWETTVRKETGKLVAVVTQTQMIMERKPGKQK